MPITDLPNELPRVPTGDDLPSKPNKKPKPVRARLPIVPRPPIARPTSPQLRRTAPRIPPNIPANLAGQFSPIPIVYGKTRVVCEPVVMPRQVGTYWICLYKVCKGEINSFQKVFLDGRSADVSGESTATEFNSTTLVGSGGKVIFWVGTSGQNVSSWMTTYISTYPDALPNQAMIAFKIHQGKFAGLPRVEVIIEGLKSIVDDRTSPATTAYSNNASLCLAHFIENFHQRTVNTASKNTAADANDEAVGSGVRRTLNLALYQPQKTSTIIATLAAHAGCFVYDAGSEMKLIPDRPASSVFDIGEALVMGQTKCRKKNRNAKPGDVKVLWYDIEANAEKPAFALGGGPVDNVSVVPMPGITNHEQAKREAIERRNHLILEDLTIDAVVRDEGLQLEVGDVVAFSDHTVGQGDKRGRVMSAALIEPGRWAVQLLEYQENAYSDSVETDPITLDTDLPDPFTVPTMTGLSASSARETTTDGSEVITVSATWDAVTWEWADRIQVQVLNTANSPDTIEWSRKVLPDETSVKARGFVGNTAHQVRVRIVSKVSPTVVGTFATDSVTTAKDTTAPSAPTSVTLSWIDAAETKVLVEISQPDTNDLAYFFIKNSQSTDNMSPPDVTIRNYTTASNNPAQIRAATPFVFNIATEHSELVSGYDLTLDIRAYDKSGNVSGSTTSNALSKA